MTDSANDDGAANDDGPGTSMSLAEALDYAVKRHRTGHPEEAAEIYRQILAVVPDHADALAFLGLAEQQAGRPGVALDLMSRSLALVPDNPAALANRGNVYKLLGELDRAEADYRRALELRPEDPATSCNLGTVLRARGDYDGAVGVFRAVLARSPDHAVAWQNLGATFESMKRMPEAAEAYREAARLEPESPAKFRNLGVAFYMAGRFAEAAEMYRRCLALAPDDPRARHLLAACTGEGVAGRASDAYIRAEFDHFAASFDAKLADLEYRGPAIVSQAVAALRDQLAPHPAVLDAGCGTGLCGPLLRPFAGTLVGVDLSPAMVERARDRGSYDELVVAELTWFLRQRVRSYDVVVSADTLVYFGDLGELLSAAATALRPGGALVFTLERDEPGQGEAGFRLQPSGRYCHTHDYVATALRQAGFVETVITEVSSRKEVERWVPGWLVRGRLAAGT